MRSPFETAGNENDALRVLFVCEGNICRSPLAELLLRSRVRSDLVSTMSAGLGAVVGAGMDAPVQDIARSWGLDPSHHRSQQLTDDHVRGNDLVLTMTRGQRDELVHRHPFGLRKVFALSEFASLAGEFAPGVAPKERVVLASQARSSVVVGPEADIIDPFRQSLEVHQQVATRIDGLIRNLGAVLWPAATQR